MRPSTSNTGSHHRTAHFQRSNYFPSHRINEEEDSYSYSYSYYSETDDHRLNQQAASTSFTDNAKFDQSEGTNENILHATLHIGISEDGRVIFDQRDHGVHPNIKASTKKDANHNHPNCHCHHSCHQTQCCLVPIATQPVLVTQSRISTGQSCHNEPLRIYENEPRQFQKYQAAQCDKVHQFKREDVKLPVPVESTTELQLVFPRIVPKYVQKELQILVPRIIEVPYYIDTNSHDGNSSPAATEVELGEVVSPNVEPIETINQYLQRTEPIPIDVYNHICEQSKIEEDRRLIPSKSRP